MPQTQLRRVISNKNVNRIDLANRKAAARYGNTPAAVSAENFNFNILNDVFYKGRQDRLQRYQVYDQMDLDTDVQRALDIWAEHCTQKDAKSETPFHVRVDNSEIGQEDADTVFEMLKVWNRLNKWDNRTFRAVRDTLKYGDFFFIRDKNYKLYPLHPACVEGIYADDENAEIQAYKVINLKRKFEFLINAQEDTISNSTNVSVYQRGGDYTTRATNYKTYSGIIAAEHIIHLSLNEGIEVGGNGQTNDIWPFGTSMLEGVFKDYKARSLLEDAEIIHRIQRAPSRRVFYIDVGKQRGDKAESFMRKVKNEMQQKRIPSSQGGRESVDTIYNPISQLDDIYLATNSEGKGTRVENLEGSAWTESDALKYFHGKFLRGLRVPTSYMLGPEEGGAVYNDGRTGTAYMQEGQFSRSCERVQNLLDNNFDMEFKLFMKYRGVEVHNGYFFLKFVPPMNFDEYRERSLNNDRLQTLASALSIPFMSKRKALTKYGNWTEDEILDNEHQWMEENLSATARQYNQDNGMGGMGVGLSTFNNAFGSPFADPNMDGTGVGDGTTDPNGLGGVGAAGGGGMGGMGTGNMGGAGGMGAGGAPGAGAGMESYVRVGNHMLTEAQYATMRASMYGGAPVPNITPIPFKANMSKPTKDKINAILNEDLISDLTGNDEATKPQKAKEALPNDKGWAKGEDDNVGRMTLASVRRLRMIREKNRKELIQRMILLQKMYATPAQPGGGMGMGF